MHALRALLTEFKILKLDFVNAFNEVGRGAVIDEVRATFPELFTVRHVGVRYALGPARHDGHLRG